jgi:TPR repeat protein
LALLYSKGEETLVSKKEAFYWYTKVAENGAELAQLNLAQLYSLEQQTATNKSQAFYWFKKPAKQGNSTSQLNLAIKFHKGEGSSR